VKHFDTVTVSKVGQSTLPKWWRDVSGLSQGGIVEVRPLHDGQNSIVLTPEPGNRRGISGKELRKQLSRGPGAAACSGSTSTTIQVSVLLDTDLLSLLERKRIPAKLAAWIADQNDLVVSAVSLAELEFGLQQAPATHRAALADWLAQTRRTFPSAIEELTEPILVRWKELLADLKKRRRTMTCEDSLIAATALLRGHTLATHNKRHFEPAGVRIIDLSSLDRGGPPTPRLRRRGQ